MLTEIIFGSLQEVTLNRAFKMHSSKHLIPYSHRASVLTLTKDTIHFKCTVKTEWRLQPYYKNANADAWCEQIIWKEKYHNYAPLFPLNWPIIWWTRVSVYILHTLIFTNSRAFSMFHLTMEEILLCSNKKNIILISSVQLTDICISWRP